MEQSVSYIVFSYPGHILMFTAAVFVFVVYVGYDDDDNDIQLHEEMVFFSHIKLSLEEKTSKKNHEDDSCSQDVEQCVIVNVSYSDREVEVQRALNDPQITITLMCSSQWATCVFQSHILHCESIY